MATMVLPAGHPVRFHPTDVQLVRDFLKRKLMGWPIPINAIAQLDIYKFAPWDLPAMTYLHNCIPEWYFFCPRGRGPRTKRTTYNGYWLTCGKVREIFDNLLIVGRKRTLIFHQGKAPQGIRSNWIMHEFTLEIAELIKGGLSEPQESFSLVKIFQKKGQGPKNRVQSGAPPIQQNRTTSVASACEPFSTRPVPSVGWTSSVSNLSSELEDIEMFLMNSPPPCQENANTKKIVSQFLSEDFNGTFDEEMIQAAEPGFGLNDMPPLGEMWAVEPGIGLDDMPPLEEMGTAEPEMGLDDMRPLEEIGTAEPGMGLDDMPPLEEMHCHDSLPPFLSQFLDYSYRDTPDFAHSSGTQDGFAKNSCGKGSNSIFMSYSDANITNYDMLPASTGSASVQNVPKAVNDMDVRSPPEPGIGLEDFFSLDPEDIFDVDVDLDDMEMTDEEFAEYLKVKKEMFSGLEDLPWLADPNFFDHADSSSPLSKSRGNAKNPSK